MSKSKPNMVEKIGAKSAGKGDMKGRVYGPSKDFDMWTSTYTTTTGKECQTKEQQQLDKYLATNNKDIEKLSESVESYKEGESLIALKQREHDDAKFQLNRPELTDEQRKILAAKSAPFIKGCLDEIARREKELIELKKQINIILRRLLKVEAELLNLIQIIENKYDQLLAIYDGAARRVYNETEPEGGLVMPPEAPTVQKMRNIGLVPSRIEGLGIASLLQNFDIRSMLNPPSDDPPNPPALSA